MVVILKNNHDQQQLSNLVSWLSAKGISVHTTVGATQTILGLGFILNEVDNVGRF